MKKNSPVLETSQNLVKKRISAISKKLKHIVAKLAITWKSSITIATLMTATIVAGHTMSTQLAVAQTPALTSLKTVPIPEPDQIGDFIRDKTAAIALGKSLFWDMQVGSDGIQACASCHFHAGADNRSKNQINPGTLRVNTNRSEQPDANFNTGGGANYQLKPQDFPFHRLADPGDRLSPVLSDSNDVVSSVTTQILYLCDYSLRV